MNSRYAPIVALAVLGVLIVGALGWFLAIKPTFATASELQSTASDVEANTALILTASAKLAQYSRDIEALPPLDESLALNAPSRFDVAVYRERIVKAASTAKVTIAELSLDSSGVVSGWELDPVTRPSFSIAKLFEAGPVGDTEAQAAFKPAVSASPEVASVVSGLTQFPIKVVVAGSYASATKFLSELRALDEQVFLVPDVQLDARNEGASAIDGVPDAEDGDVLLTITGYFYLLDPDTTVIDDDGVLGTVPPAKTSPFIPGDGMSVD